MPNTLAQPSNDTWRYPAGHAPVAPELGITLTPIREGGGQAQVEAKTDGQEQYEYRDRQNEVKTVDPQVAQAVIEAAEGAVAEAFTGAEYAHAAQERIIAITRSIGDMQDGAVALAEHEATLN